MATYREALDEAEKMLCEAGIKEWKSDALILFEHALLLDRSQLFLEGDREVSDTGRLYEYIQKRISGTPVQYITGKAYFYGYTFFVNESVLIPRFDTEVLVENAIKAFHGDRILDMCTGSGCIAITLALETGANVCAADISPDALEVADYNAHALNADVRFVESDLFENITDTYDMIVSNPPYIRSNIIETLDEEVKSWEPRLALDGGDDGLNFYRKITKDSTKALNDNGILIFEIGYDQANAVTKLLEEAGFTNVTVCRDLAGLDRVVSGKYRK